jgi:hypothetical protein
MVENESPTALAALAFQATGMEKRLRSLEIYYIIRRYA